MSVLIVASSVFCAFHDITLLVFLGILIASNAATSYAVEYSVPDRRRLYATLDLVANLAILVFFEFSLLMARSFFASGQKALGIFARLVPA